MPKETKPSDHDRLIRIETLLDRVISDLAEMKSNLLARVETLENGRITKEDHEVLEKRINNLENWRWYIIGIGSVLIIIIDYAIRNL